MNARSRPDTIRYDMLLLNVLHCKGLISVISGTVNADACGGDSDVTHGDAVPPVYPVY
jgi:hypothetical protein